MKSSWTIAGACIAALALAGCTTTQTQVSKSSTISWTAPTKRVLLVEPDVKLGELEAGGAIEWRADWSKTGTQYIQDDVRGVLIARGIDVAQSGTVTDPHGVQIVKLNDVVDSAIYMHAIIGGNFKLPTKKEPFDFTLGPGVTDFGTRYGADYALFVVVRDSYTSAGRAALMIGAAILGVGVTGGQQVGYASLVDLKTGNVVWFNWLQSSNGDLRTAEPAQKVVDNLLHGIPL